MVICTTLTVTGTPAGVSIATIFNWCWKVGLGSGSCNLPPDTPAVKVGDAVTIQADVVNTGDTGKVRAVIKIDGVQLLSQDNPSLVPLPAGSIWNVRTTYTMPNKNVTLTVEGYGWNGSTWTLNSTKSNVISMTAPSCSSISLDPIGGAQLDPSSTNN